MGDICADCASALPYSDKSCRQCGDALTGADAEADVLCGSCIKQPPVYQSTYAPLRFEEPVRSMISRFKFQRDLVAGRILTECVIDRLSGGIDKKASNTRYPDALIPVPLHRWRYWQRGFNQAQLIARDLQRGLHQRSVVIDLLPNALQRIRHTPPQSGLETVERRRNLRNAFQVNPATRLPAHVALIDDVMTTGSTVMECARVLKKAGCERIDVWVLARALKD